jgi:hypothetical protein
MKPVELVLRKEERRMKKNYGGGESNKIICTYVYVTVTPHVQLMCANKNVQREKERERERVTERSEYNQILVSLENINKTDKLIFRLIKKME